MTFRSRILGLKEKDINGISYIMRSYKKSCVVSVNQFISKHTNSNSVQRISPMKLQRPLDSKNGVTVEFV